MALDEFIGWYRQELRPGFTKARISAWRVSLEARGGDTRSATDDTRKTRAARTS